MRQCSKFLTLVRWETAVEWVSVEYIFLYTEITENKNVIKYAFFMHLN